MVEWSPYELTDFEYEVLRLYLKHGYQYEFLFDVPFFNTHYTRETVLMNLRQFANHVNKYRKDHSDDLE